MGEVDLDTQETAAIEMAVIAKRGRAIIADLEARFGGRDRLNADADRLDKYLATQEIKSDG